MGWTTKTFTFVANSSSSTLSFVCNIGFVTNAGAAIDNVSVDPIVVSAIPLDWAQWVAALLVVVAGAAILHRRRSA